jgi:hypothetical protein
MARCATRFSTRTDCLRTFLERSFVMSRPHKPPPRICLKTYMRGIRGGHDGFVEDIDETLVCDFSRYKARYSNAPFELRIIPALPGSQETVPTT